jgi:cAMP-dependent protein kinase regulator
MVQQLKRIARFSILDDDVLAGLAVVVTAERFSPGTVICQQGKVEDKFYGIEFGTVLVRTTVGDQEIIVAQLSAGDAFGERALYEALPRTATVVVETTVDLLGLHRKDYQRLVQKYPALERILVGPDVVPILGQVPLFSRLSQEELTELSRHVGVRYYPRGRRVAQQGDMGATMYVVIDGDLVAYQMDESGRRRPVKALKKGDAFGETSLLVGEPRDATVVVKTEAEICYLHKAAFDEFLEAHPQVRNKLIVRPDVERKWRVRPFPGQSPDEIIEIRDNKHWVALLRAVWLPSLLWILAGVVIVIAHKLGLFGESEWLSVLLAVSWVASATAMGPWYWIDWRNDYHIVTSQRVIHIERELFLAATTDVVPIEQVQNVEVTQGLWGSLLGYGHVRVATASAAGWLMELLFVREPEAFQQSIFEQIGRARFRAVAQERVEIRGTIRQATGMSELEDVVEEEPTPTGKAPPSWLPHLTQSRPVKRLRRIFSEFGIVVFLRRPHLPRQEILEDNDVIWRKHWVILLAATYRPLLLCLVIVPLTAVTLAGGLDWFNPLDLAPSLLSWALLPLGLSLIAVLLRLAWKVEDWRNDQYIVTNTHIIDIERTPFLLNESQRQARLESIENTQATTQGFWRSLLKLGDVTIETAGEGTFTFTQVRNPTKVQAEIERRREAYRELVRRQEAERRRGEIARWLSVYSDVAGEEKARAQQEDRQQLPKSWVEESEEKED